MVLAQEGLFAIESRRLKSMTELISRIRFKPVLISFNRYCRAFQGYSIEI